MKEIMIALISSGVGAGLLALIQFLITHFTESKTHKEDRINNLSQLDSALRQHLVAVNNQWKSDYCDKHAESIEELRTAILTLTDDAKQRSQYEKAIGESLMALTHDKLVSLGRRYQRRGAITLAEQTNLTMLYKPYHDGLGGNHDGERWYKYCMEELDVVTEERAMEMDRGL